MMGRIYLFALLTAGLFATELPAEVVTFKASPNITLGEREVPVDLALRLKDISTTRIAIESVIDLRRAQEMLIDELTGSAFVDVCDAKISVTEAVAETDDIALTLGGRIEAQVFDCEGQLGADRKRGERVYTAGLTVAASASAVLRDQCLYFSLVDLRLTPDRFPETAESQETVAQVKDIFFKATDAIFTNHPICPELPAELSSLAPTYDAGGTRELGDGGIGVFFQGSLDASTDTIIDILKVLQSKGVLPPPPK
ncbi:hypothetical protein [Tateyamaria sp. Alg231-49]|uniref:hypothetical protein n=1 Tax=Tateyamaria sp. Alg231-49 TaxID=1922219 RepID=UPI00131EE399|nr:hypothetical protein [Tateyamaria sp. Alg231-49]